MATGASGSGFIGHDPVALTIMYINSLGIDHNNRGFRLFNLRDKATSKEIQIVARKLALDLHPDKDRITQWLQLQGITDERLQGQVKQQLQTFYNLVLEEKDKLVDFDEKFFKQATHRDALWLCCALVHLLAAKHSALGATQIH